MRFGRVTVGLVDQAVIAVANATNTLLALALLDRSRAGVMLLSLGLGYFVVGVNRSFVGEVLLVLASRCEGERQVRLVRNGASAALVFGVAASVVLTVVWLVLPPTGGVDLRDLIWVAAFLPALLLHDTARYGYLADRRPQRALAIDAVWVGVQLLGVLVVSATGRVTAGALFTCWGIGATAGATVFLLRSRIRVWQGRPRQWLAETRHLSGWFAATALVGQVHSQAVGFLVAGRLSARELSGLRGAQTVLLQPGQNVIMAMMGLLAPRASRLAADAERPGPNRQDATAALRGQTRTAALGLALLATVAVAVVVPVADTVMVRVPKFADIAPIVLPVAIQPGIYLVQLPFAAAIRGMHRARLLLVQYVVFAVASLTGLVVGAGLARLPGAAWGLTAGSAIGLAVMVGLYRYAVRRLDVSPETVSGPRDAQQPATLA